MHTCRVYAVLHTSLVLSACSMPGPGGRAAEGPPLRQSQNAMATTCETVIGAHGDAGCALRICIARDGDDPRDRHRRAWRCRVRATAVHVYRAAPELRSRLATCAMLCTARCGAVRYCYVRMCVTLRVALCARAALLLRLRAASLLWLLIGLLRCCAAEVRCCYSVSAAAQLRVVAGAVQTEVRCYCAYLPCIRRAAHLTRALCMHHAGAGRARCALAVLATVSYAGGGGRAAAAAGPPRRQSYDLLEKSRGGVQSGGRGR